MQEHKSIKVLDHGHVRMVEPWGSDEQIVRAARMSTGKGFLGWGPGIQCEWCGEVDAVTFPVCNTHDSEQHRMGPNGPPGDEKLLAFLWNNKHATPFEMAGATIEIKAPIMVFREWHRHRTQSYNEMSARYIPLPDENYTPDMARMLMVNAATTNKQAAGLTAGLSEADALSWLADLADVYEHAQRVYQRGIALGVAKELARLPVPVARYSRMMASANLRNWLAFLALRSSAKNPAAQWEIRQFADAVHTMLSEAFPRTMALFDGRA